MKIVVRALLGFIAVAVLTNPGPQAACNQPGESQECFAFCNMWVGAYCAGTDIEFGTTTVDVDPMDDECTNPPETNPPGGDDYDCNCGFVSNPGGVSRCRFEFYTSVWGPDQHWFKDEIHE